MSVENAFFKARRISYIMNYLRNHVVNLQFFTVYIYVFNHAHLRPRANYGIIET